MKRLASLLALVVVAGCGGGNAPPPRLVDGTTPPRVPNALEGLHGAVMTRTRVAAASEIDPIRLRTCNPAVSELVRRSIVVERYGVAGGSLTFAYASRPALYVCDAIPQVLPDPDRPEGSPWCGASYGKTVHGRLTDPRLDLCQGRDHTVTGFAWVHPARDARWLVVRDGDRREVYPVAGGLPVRVTTVAGVDAARSSASFPIEEYAADGTKLRAYTLNAAVAG